MRRRTFLLVGGITVLVIAAGLYGLGLYWDRESVRGDPNIGAGVAMMFGEIFAGMGLCCLVAWAITALVIWLRKRTSADR